MKRNPKGVRFADLYKVCEHHFGNPRQRGTSHAVFKMPWLGDPRVNIQDDKGEAKPYQVRQVLKSHRKVGGVMTQSVAQPEVSHYAYRVVWSAEDQEFVATCAEFPSLSWLARDQVEALHGLEGLVKEVLVDLEAEGADLPQPLAERPFSGKLNLRLGSHLHRRVALEAAEAGLSINSYLVRKFS